jgi:hypothetical protein
MEIRKILTLQNFHFLSTPETQSPLEEIKISPDTPCEGELGVDTLNARLQGMKGSVHENAAHRPNNTVCPRVDKMKCPQMGNQI